MNSPKGCGLGGQSSRFKVDTAITAACNYNITVDDIGSKKTVVKQLRLSPASATRGVSTSPRHQGEVARSAEWLISNKECVQVPGPGMCQVLH